MVAIISENVEMYIKTIWTLKQSKGHAKTIEISSMLKVVPSSVTEMLQRLQQDGFVVHTDYKGCQLTKKGNALASKLIHKENLLRRFLHEILKIPKNKVQDEACKLEHYISKETEKSLYKFLSRPDKHTVDKKPILKCAECMNKFS
jgi:DtxR family Mn-dependent transcriptional regulator